MSSELDRFLAFLEAQAPLQAPRFHSLGAPKILSFMATTALPGSAASVSIHPVREVAPGPSARELRVRLAGALPRPPGPGECVTVHLTRPEQYQGYQVKSLPLSDARAPADLLSPGPGGFTVLGAQVFSVHHSPYTLRFFDPIPYEDVRDLAAAVRHAIVCVGPTANVSPRFVFHHEARDGRVALFHGDGLALKTYMNLRANRREVRLVVDLDEATGFALQGAVEEIAEADHPVAYRKVQAGFAAGGWGRPSRVFRLVAEAIEPVAPRA